MPRAARARPCRGSRRRSRCACRCADPRRQERLQHPLLEHLDVERIRARRVRRPAAATASCATCPPSSTGHLAGTLGRGAALAQPGRRRAAPSSSDAGVCPARSLTTRLYGQDLHLLVGKRDGDEPLEVAAAVAPAARIAWHARDALAARWCPSAMYSASSAAKASTSASRSAPVDPPDGVARRRRARRSRRSASPALTRRDDGVDGLAGAVGQEDEPGLRPQFGDVPRAVVLLVAARLLVLLDEAAVVFVHREAAGQARSARASPILSR